MHEVGRLEPVARREHAVTRGGGAATLHVPEHGHPRLEARAGLDLLGERVADAPLREPRVPELVHVALLVDPLELVPLGDDHDREVLAAGMAAADLLAGVVDADRELRDHDHVRAAGDSAHHGDPARVTAHHLDNHHAVVRLGGGVQPVDRLGADEHRGVEAEGVVGPGKVVVDRLRHADDREVVLFVQSRGDSQVVGTLLPGPRIAALTGNRILYRDGVAIAALAGGEIQWIQTLEPGDARAAEDALTRRQAGSLLLAYLR